MWPTALITRGIITAVSNPNLGRIQVSFVEYEKRHGKATKPYMDQIREQMKGIPGASIEVAQEDGGLRQILLLM